MKTDISALLRNAGLKVTRQRAAILQIVLAATTHLTAEDIYKELTARQVDFSLATVYRTLSLLEGAGLLEQKSIPGSACGYFVFSKNRHRHHLVCVECKKNIRLDHCPVEEFSRGIAEKNGFTLTGHSFEIYGICPVCRNAHKK